MKNCKKIKVFFVEALYDELAAPQLTQLQEHLKECRKCASQYEEMKTTLGLMSQKTEEKPTEEFWKKFTDNVMEKIEKKNKKSSFFVMPKWSLQLAGAAALVIMGIFIGRYIKATPVVEQSIANNYVNTQAGVYPAAVTRQAAQYLEKSKILLLGVVNMDTEGVKQQSMDFSHQRKVSRDLVHQA
ncbi:MAG: hypothetical protein KAR38_17595, partial [Calditrichia bacterium]|nr:hypothetical protein [Calditrichia bacterium]